MGMNMGLSKNVIHMGAEGRVPRFAQRRVILFFWPIRASSWNQISMAVPDGIWARILAT